MNPDQTGMAQVPFLSMLEVSLGPYAQDLVQGYITSMQLSDVMQQQQFNNLDQFHQLCRQLPQFKEAYLLDQPICLGNWTVYGNFYPCRIMQVPNIPSRNKADQGQNVVLMYTVDRNFPVQNRFNFVNRNLCTLLGWYCGPSRNGSCPCGARLVGSCSHATTAMSLGFCLLTMDSNIMTLIEVAA